jgi:hypothetical protein
MINFVQRQHLPLVTITEEKTVYEKNGNVIIFSWWLFKVIVVLSPLSAGRGNRLC